MSVSTATNPQLFMHKGGDIFIWNYRAGEEGAVLRDLGHQATNGWYGLDWIDVAALSFNLGRQMPEGVEAC